MATPIRSTDTQEGCNPISSNCVLWQGPDIPCIQLCHGDTVSDVTYKMGIELCTLVDQLDITGFDVSCFPPICPKPENIHDLIQFILDTLCNITPSGSTGTFDCTDVMNCQMSIAPCFQYTNQFGDTVTQMSLSEYASAIATKICGIIDGTVRIPYIDNTITDIEERLDTLEACVLPCTPPVVVIEIPTSCLTPTATNIPIETFVETTELALCALQNSIGSSTEINSAIGQQCINLDVTPTLNNSAVTYNALPGWVSAGSYNTIADSINNMWILMCDMRTAVASVVANCCNITCDSVDITMTADFTSPNIELTFGGTALGFADCYAAGMFVTITDSYGVSFTTQVPVIANLGGATQLVNISTSGLNLFTNYTVQLDVCADAGTLRCNKTLISTISNSNFCPSMSYAPDQKYIDYSFTNNIASPVTYTIECWNSTGTTIIATSSEINPAVGAVSGRVPTIASGGVLTASTTYQLRVTVTVGTTVKTCPFTSVTTTI